MNYRNKTTGEISTQGELRRANRNTSFPRVWDADVCTLLDIDPILAAPRPSITDLQVVNGNGAVTDARGNWVEAWAISDKFADTTDDDGVTTTKSAHESAHTASLVAAVAATARATRDELLTATDFYALSDVTMSSAMATYRTALRNVPAQSEFPATISWPTAP